MIDLSVGVELTLEALSLLPLVSLFTQRLPPCSLPSSRHGPAAASTTRTERFLGRAHAWPACCSQRRRADAYTRESVSAETFSTWNPMYG